METNGIMIGAGIGGVVGLIVVLRMFGWQKKLVAKIEAGDTRGARALLEKHAPPVKPAKSFSNLKLIPQRTRVLGLWLLGDVDAVRQELAQHAGGPAYLANVQLFGLLALATEPDADAATLVAQMEQASARVATEGNALQKLLKDYAAMLANLGQGLALRPVDATLVGKLLSKVSNEPALTKIVIARAMLVSAERAGHPTGELHHRLAALTKRWAARA